MSALKITSANFEKEILNSDKPVLLDFWAAWCGPCRMMSPVIDDVAKERPDVKVGKVNVDENPDLAAQFEIMTIPTLIVIKDGEIVNQAIGVKPKNQVIDMI